MLADQHASTGDGVVTNFFGHPARSHSSPAKLHLKTKVPILVTVLRRTDNPLCFEFACHDPIIFEATGNNEQDIQAITQLYTTALEDLIRQAPEQWLWTHRRWLNLNR